MSGLEVALVRPSAFNNSGRALKWVMEQLAALTFTLPWQSLATTDAFQYPHVLVLFMMTLLTSTKRTSCFVGAFERTKAADVLEVVWSSFKASHPCTEAPATWLGIWRYQNAKEALQGHSPAALPSFAFWLFQNSQGRSSVGSHKSHWHCLWIVAFL